MPSKSSTIVPKSQVSYPLTALHMKVGAYLCYCLLSPDLRNMTDELNAFDLCLIFIMFISVIRTCHNKLNSTCKCVDSSKEFTSKYGIVSRVDVLDN